MKYPKIPTKPYAPYKPQPPLKQIEQKTPLGDLSSMEDCEQTIQSLTVHMQKSYPNVDPNKIRFTMEVQRDYGYYENELSTSIVIKFYAVDLIDNPHYDRLYKSYKEQLEKYEKDYQSYKKALKQYKIDEEQYKIDCENWQVEHAKSILAKHEEKKAGKKK